MSCCPGSTAPLTQWHRVRVRYGGARPIRVKGTVTGTEYHFSGLERLQLLDPRDAVSIVRNPLFRAEGVLEMIPVKGAPARAGSDG
jgi:hypothetical protein